MTRKRNMTRPNFVALCLLTALGVAPHAAADEKPLRLTIDAEVKAAWEREKVTPAPRAGDAEFLRRVHLDLLGAIPTADEVRQFLQDADPKKRERLIDRLLDDPRFAAHQAAVWDLVLFGRHPEGYEATRKRPAFKKWIADKFARNTPYDRFVHDLLLAEEEGSELFYVQFRAAPEDATVAVSRIFLGTQLQCARCHDHPFENWTQKDFYGMAGFFVRLVVFDPVGPKVAVGEKSTGEVLFTGSVKDQKPGQKGEPIRPKFLGGAVLDEPPLPKDFKEPPSGAKTLPKPVFSRKAKLAEWASSPDNPYLAKGVANRVWAQFIGRGLGHPVEDLGEKSDISHPELLKALAAQMVAHKFDLKWYIRELVNSETYQLAAAGPGTDAMPKWHERGRVRPLSAEELMASLRVATGYDVDKKPGTPLPGDTVEYFLRYFGEPTNGLGDFQGGLTEHLFFNNSSNVRAMIQRRKGNLADTMLTSAEAPEKRVERLFLATLSRPPRPDETKRFVAHLASDPKAADALVEEAIWVLLNTAEFRFNH
jgi:hypothetical protein